MAARHAFVGVYRPRHVEDVSAGCRIPPGLDQSRPDRQDQLVGKNSALQKRAQQRVCSAGCQAFQNRSEGVPDPGNLVREHM
jgi:hypothetical protein